MNNYYWPANETGLCYYLFRQVNIQWVILFFFFTYAEIVTDIQSKPAAIPQPAPAGFDTALAEGKIIFIAVKNIIHTDRNGKFLFEELPVDTGIQSSECA